jgi:hypothetical protein
LFLYQAEESGTYSRGQQACIDPHGIKLEAFFHAAEER